MDIQYSLYDLAMYLLLYGFLGWVCEVCCLAVRDRRFINRGFLNLPLSLPHGIVMAVLILVLPTLRQNLALQLAFSWIILCLVWKLSDQFVHNVSRRSGIEDYKARTILGKGGLLVSLIMAGVYLLVYLIIHPLFFGLVELMPGWLEKALVIVFSLVTAVDYISVRYTLRTSKPLEDAQRRKAGTQRLGDRMANNIWRRLQRAYPGIQEAEDLDNSGHIFARGICFDKLVWVFLISAFLGDLIETVFCRVVGGSWMSRSSLLYGPFSVVWGFGAVVLTVALQRLAGKEDRKVFLAGFVIGGAYEYLCSVVTEIVFGTVFWDYSHMPLNIGGRTNVLFCIFWGLLSVVWIKILYPPMDRAIEKVPPLWGKILTWVVVFVMLCNSLLTAGAMARYTQRKIQPEPRTVIEQFLDSRYDDAWMENRWPNMIVTE